MGKVVLKLTDVQKSIGDKKIVHGLTFEVKEGEIYGFLGPNGSGKTTTIRMITGLISMTHGDIQICGHSIATEREKALVNIGAIVENPELYEYMSGRQNLVHFANMANHKVSKARINEIIQLVDLAEAIHAPVKTYSLGMKQRLGIAAALLPDPDLLVLDEPTNGLDPEGIVEIRKLLMELGAGGKTVFVSSHLLAEIQAACDWVVMLNKGILAFSGTLEELLHEASPTIRASAENPSDNIELIRVATNAGHHAITFNGGIEVEAAAEWTAELNRLAWGAGITLRDLHVPAADLERAFFAMTGDHKEGGG